MGSSSDYLARLQAAIEKRHGCAAVYRETVPVTETFHGRTVWQGDVEVFDLTGHPKAKRCYAWKDREGHSDAAEQFVVVLEIPPVISARTAVHSAMVSDSTRN